MVWWRPEAYPIGSPWYARRRRRVQKVHHSMCGDSGGSRVFTIVCWKAGADPKGFHGMLESRGGSRGFTVACWKAEADPEGLPWYAERQCRI